MYQSLLSHLTVKIVAVLVFTRENTTCRDFSETKQFPVFVKQLYLNIKTILAVNSFKQRSFYVWKKSACLQFSLEYIPIVWRGNTTVIHKATNEVFLLFLSAEHSHGHISVCGQIPQLHLQCMGSRATLRKVAVQEQELLLVRHQTF